MLVAVHESQCIGVDVEYTHRRNDVLRIADRYFSARELEQLAALPEDKRRERFFDLWTLKESYVKAVGRGIGLGLGRFSFLFDERHPELLQSLERDAGIADECPHWHSRVATLDEDFKWAVTVAAEPGQAPPDVEILPCELAQLRR